MFKVEIHKKDFLISVETFAPSDEPKVRKLIDDIVEKFSKDDLNEKKLAE